MANNLNLEGEIEKILAAPLYKPGEFVPEEEKSKHHFIDAPTKEAIEYLKNMPAIAKEEVSLLEELQCDKRIYISIDIHQLLNKFFRKNLLPSEILDKVDFVFNIVCQGSNKRQTEKKLDVVALCSYARKYKKLKNAETKKLGNVNVKGEVTKKISGNFKTREILLIFGITTDDVKIFLEDYFIYPEWKNFSEQWEIIVKNRSKVVSVSKGNSNNKEEKNMWHRKDTTLRF